MISFLKQLNYSKRIFILSLISCLFTINSHAQTITSISSAGAVSAGSSSAYNLKWTTSTTTTNIEKQIDFYSADLPGKYAIVVQGLSSDGLLGSNIKYITVK